MGILLKMLPAGVNHTTGRKGKQLIAVVNHITGALMPSPLNTFLNPINKVSSHVIICQNGDIIRLVADEDTAYHAGIVNKPNWPLYDGSNPNYYTYGIEHEGFDGTLTELQYQASLWEQKRIRDKFGLPPDTNHFIGHYRIDSVDRPYCPGVHFPWLRIIASLKQSMLVNVIAGNKYMVGLTDAEGHSYVPIRAMSQALNFTYVWDGPSCSVTIGGRVVKVRLEPDAGYAKTIDLVAAIGNGLSAAWDNPSQTVIVA